MTFSADSRAPFRRYLSAWIGFSAGGHFSQSLAVAIVLYAFSLHTIRALIGWPGSIAVLAALVTLASVSLFGARHHIEWHGILPLSLIALFGFMGLSVLWSQYTWASIGGVAYSVAFAALGMYLALGRDLIQVVRAVGDALRILLTVSLSLEVLSGLLIDMPIAFLGIRGDIAFGGPIQGISGSRNVLGFLAALALVTFATEYLTRSISRARGATSMLLALLCLFFAKSPVTAVAVVVLVIAALALRALRAVPAPRRSALQTALAVVVIVGAVLAFVMRGALLHAIGATSDVTTRLQLWDRLEDLIAVHPIQGWGWVGQWPTQVFPFSTVTTAAGRPYESGLSALFDAWFQIGLIGLVVLVVAGVLALVRSWLTASSHPIVAYVWPTMVLLLIGVTATAESFLLFEGTLMLFVTIATISARKRSWRSRLGGNSLAR